MLGLRSIYLPPSYIGFAASPLFFPDSSGTLKPLFKTGDRAFSNTNDPCCCPECTPCKADTFSTTSIATVDFGGTITNDDCTSCSADLLTPTFELPKLALPASSPFDPCTYELVTDIGCNSGTDGFNKLQFQWYVDDGINARAVLELFYSCDSDTHYGSFEWTKTFTYSPTLYDCLATIALGTGTLKFENCNTYAPCFMSSVTASVSFS